jgi:hypothetical protein
MVYSGNRSIEPEKGHWSVECLVDDGGEAG